MSNRLRQSERGLALVSVLWALSILSLIAASMASTGNLSSQMQRNLLRRTQAETIVDAAIAVAILRLLDTRAEKRPRVDGVANDVAFGGAQVSVSIQDQLGLLDINEVDTSLLKSLFESVGVTPDQATILADRIVAWRTRDARDSRRANNDEYVRAGYNYTPRHGRFESVEELRLVIGITPEIFARVAPALTVHSHRPSLDLAIAPREALLAVPGADEKTVDETIKRRALSAPSPTPQGTTIRAGTIDPTIPLTGRTFGIRGEMSMGQDPVVRRAMILITGDPANPYLVLDWK
jgi:general secretion pathway protein K